MFDTDATNMDFSSGYATRKIDVDAADIAALNS